MCENVCNTRFFSLSFSSVGVVIVTVTEFERIHISTLFGVWIQFSSRWNLCAASVLNSVCVLHANHCHDIEFYLNRLVSYETRAREY